MRPRTEDDYSPAELATAVIDMGRILEREPQLGNFGFGVYAPRRRDRRGLHCPARRSVRQFPECFFQHLDRGMAARGARTSQATTTRVRATT